MSWIGGGITVSITTNRKAGSGDNIYNPHGNVDAYRSYRDAVYLNGANFLEDLRTLLGDEAFFGVLEEYLTQYKGRIATSRDFFSLLDRFPSTEIETILDNYFQDW